MAARTAGRFSSAISRKGLIHRKQPVRTGAGQAVQNLLPGKRR